MAESYYATAGHNGEVDELRCEDGAQVLHIFDNNQYPSWDGVDREPGIQSYHTYRAPRIPQDHAVDDQHAAFEMRHHGFSTTHSYYEAQPWDTRQPDTIADTSSVSPDDYNLGLSPVRLEAQGYGAIRASQGALPQLYFANFEQVNQAVLTRIPMHNFVPSINDPTIPQTDEVRQSCVIRLRGAFLDVGQYHDQTNHRNIGVRWMQIAAGRNPHVLRQIELVCWKLLEMAEALHRNGPAVLEIFDSGKLRKVYTSRKCSFRQRINDMCDIMRISKARCETLLAMDDLQMFVGAPAHMGALSRRMKSSNARRQEQLIAGRRIQNYA